jgi:hypothetical protein
VFPRNLWLIYTESPNYNPDRNIGDVEDYMVGGLIGAVITTIIVSITKKFKLIMLVLIVCSVIGLIIFHYSLYLNDGSKFMLIGIIINGTSSLSFYSICFEFIVRLAPKKGESLTTGSVNLCTAWIVIILYFLASIRHDFRFGTKVILFTMYVTHGLALIMLVLFVPENVDGEDVRSSMISMYTGTMISNN